MDLFVQPDDLCDVQASEDERELAAHAASEFMWAKTGRQFGIGVDTIRPCRGPVGSSSRFDLPNTLGFAYPAAPSLMTSGCGCGQPDSCSCRTTSWFKLPRDKVREVTEVTVDGVTLDESEYALRGRNRLYRVGASWPCCQYLDLDPSEVGTWQVSYIFGRRVPKLVELGTKRLGCEFVKLMVGDPSCRIPKNARSVVARGISVELAKFFEENGYTGLFEVDAAIKAANPSGAVHRATAWSPELTEKSVRVPPQGS